jgi:hypothetical protein
MSHTTTNNSSRYIVENILFLFIPSFLATHILKSSAVSENVCPHPSSVEHYVGKFLFEDTFAFG